MFYFPGSTSSLIAGLAFGCILGYGAYQTSIDEKNYLLSLSNSLFIYKTCSMLSMNIIIFNLFFAL